MISRMIMLRLDDFRLTMCVLGLLFGLGCQGNDSGKTRELANSAAQAGNWQEAEIQLARLTDPNQADWLLRAIVANNLKNLDQAEAFLLHVGEDGVLGAQAALCRARIEASRYRAGRMEEALKRALSLDSRLIEARKLLVYLYGTQGRRGELIEELATLAETTPAGFDLLSHLCIAQEEETINEPAHLKEELAKYLAADSADRWSRLALARNERKLGQFDQALETLAVLPESDPEARAYRVEIATDRGDFDEVQKLLAEGQEDHALLARLRGGLALRKAEAELAVKLYRRSNALEPDHPSTVYGLAESLRLSGEAQEALEWKRRSDAHRKLREIMITREQNRTPPLRLSCEVGALAEAAGLLRQARAWYRLAISLDPLDSDARQALFRLKDADAGVK